MFKVLTGLQKKEKEKVNDTLTLDLSGVKKCKGCHHVCQVLFEKATCLPTLQFWEAIVITCASFFPVMSIISTPFSNRQHINGHAERTVMMLAICQGHLNNFTRSSRAFTVPFLTASEETFSTTTEVEAQW